MPGDQAAPRAEAKVNATSVPSRDCGFNRLRSINVVRQRPARSALPHRKSQQDPTDGRTSYYRALRTVSSAVLQDEAGLEAAEARLAWSTARHALEVRSLPHTHPLWSVMNDMMGRVNRHKSPLFETWSRHHSVIPRTKAQAPTAKLPYVLQPWHDLRGFSLSQAK